VAPWIGLTRGPVGWGRVRLRARPRPAPKAAGGAPPRFRPHPYDHGCAEDFMARSNGPRHRFQDRAIAIAIAITAETDIEEPQPVSNSGAGQSQNVFDTSQARTVVQQGEFVRAHLPPCDIPTAPARGPIE
jgi:hypothetical protein